MKRCSKCKKRKSYSKFYKNKQTKDGFRSDCKKCCSNHYRKYYQTHKTEKAKCMKKYQQTHKVKLATYDKEYYQTIIGNLRKRFIKIKQRCSNPKCSGYKWYGGRGIKCLFQSADEFIDYIFNGLQIDRINNNGHYERGNIRLTTAKENSNNRRKH